MKKKHVSIVCVLMIIVAMITAGCTSGKSSDAPDTIPVVSLEGECVLSRF